MLLFFPLHLFEPEPLDIRQCALKHILLLSSSSSDAMRPAAASQGVFPLPNSSVEPFYPLMVFQNRGGGNLGSTNHADRDRTFQLDGLPDGVTVSVDNQNGIIEADSELNPYEGFNFLLFRLMRGDNRLTVRGDGVLTMTCAYPVNVGG